MLIHADVRAYAATYDGPRFHALLSDAPYELAFMGREWDASGIAFEVATWRALTAPLYPGAFGMVFGGSRGWHRLACAIEDAGMIIHPTIFGWAYGSGFPKATRIDTQIDRAAGVEREVVGSKAVTRNLARNGRMGDEAISPVPVVGTTIDITAPATALAAAWEGHRYGLQALKPAIEPIIVFQKPYSGRPVENITRTGAGALNIDAGRVGTDDTRGRASKTALGMINDDAWQAREIMAGSSAGRWPANLVLLHLPACADECAPGCAVAALGAQSGEREVSGSAKAGKPASGVYPTGMFGVGDRQGVLHNDTGTASRYFYNADYMLERLEAADAVRYVPKASTAEREAGLEAADDGRANIHATVKPISLARYLASLLLPPDAYAPRRLLVPFAGVGSEMIGAELAGWDEVVGVEREAEHIPIAHARLAWWRRAARRLRTTDPRVILANEEIAHKESLFDLEA